MSTIEPYLYPEVAAQIAKDFSSCGIDLVFPQNPTKAPREELFDVLYPIIRLILKEQPSLMLKIIYRIDISEHQFGAQMGEKLGDIAYTTLAQMIINRETQKVLLRKGLS
ncbi:MAG: hypothetical protein ACOVOO_00815 [Flavobacteriales bacterium]|jgi:hypothetical protein